MKKVMISVLAGASMFAIGCKTDCDTGYTGSNCDVQMFPSTITMNKVTVSGWDETKGDGSGWDLTDGPDMYFKIFDNDTEIFTSNTVNDLSSGVATVDYTDGMPFNISNAADNFSIKFYDSDDILGDELMGDFAFDMYSDDNGFPEQITLENPDGSDFNVTIFVDYNF